MDNPNNTDRTSHAALPETAATEDNGGRLSGSPQPSQNKAAGRFRPFKAIAVLLGVIALLFLISLAVVFPRSDIFVVELGSKMSVSPADYLFGYDFVLKHASIDTSEVDTGKTGDYKAGARWFFYDYTLAVRVQDTTPPEIIPFAEPLYIASGREYSPEEFASGICDISGQVQCRLKYGGKEWERIAFPIKGSYRVLLEAEDPSGNIGSKHIEFTVDDAPVIIGAFDRHLPVGTDFDPSSTVAADSRDGLITDRMKIDRGGFNPGSEGDYTVTYTVADSYGLQTEKSVTISVCGKDRLSLYGDGSEKLSLTNGELELLCELDYFRYRPLSQPDFDRTVEMIEPTLLDLRQDRGYGFAAGSGCIYKITPQYIYMLSVKHVLKEVNRNCEIMFFDGVTIKEDIAYATSKQHNELAVFRIPTENVPVDTLLRLRQVHVDPDIYSKLSEGDSVVAYAKHWTGTDEDLIRPMKIRRLTSSISEFAMFNSLLETTAGTVSGMSGTAVVDYRGNLVGLASAHGPSTGNQAVMSTFHSKIDVLPEAEAALEALNDADKAA